MDWLAIYEILPEAVPWHLLLVALPFDLVSVNFLFGVLRALGDVELKQLQLRRLALRFLYHNLFTGQWRVFRMGLAVKDTLEVV